MSQGSLPSLFRQLLLLLLLLAGSALFLLISEGAIFEHLQFQHSYALFLLLGVPWLIYRGRRQRVVERNSILLGSLKPLQHESPAWAHWLREVPLAALVCAYTLLCIAAASPIDPEQAPAHEKEGIDMMIALDMSGSMQAALENTPDSIAAWMGQLDGGRLPDRLDTAKAALRQFLSLRKSDRIGAVVFGAEARILSPPTLDYELLDTLLSQMRLGLIDPNGTVIGDAIGVSVARLRHSNSPSKVIILLTDGASMGDSVSPKDAAEMAKEAGVAIYAIQIGTGEGLFPVQSLFGVQYQKQKAAVDPELLKELADSTGGQMFVVEDGEALSNSLHKILDKLETTEFEAPVAHHRSLLQPFVITALALLGLIALLRATLLRNLS